MLGIEPKYVSYRASWGLLLGLSVLACGDDDSAGAASDDRDAGGRAPVEETATDAGESDAGQTDIETDEETDSGTTDVSEPEATDIELEAGVDASTPVPTLDAGVDAAVGPDAEADSGPAAPQAQQVVDLAELSGSGGFRRVFGTPEGNGQLGVPVAASRDIDGDGLVDAAMTSFLASPLDRAGAGQVYVLFGDGTINGDIDLEEPRDDVLMVYGAGNYEGAGSEVWIDDVTGDGIGDLLVCRQNYRASDPDRIGAGALSIIVGGPHLRDQLEAGQPIDLATPPDTVPIVTFVGGEELGRFGIWVRTGDATGDGIADLVVGADQETIGDEVFRGASYLIRGGSHLSQSLNVDMADYGVTPLEGHLAKMTPPAGESERYHFGATVTIADLDRNGRGEVLSAAALTRSGAAYPAEDAPSGSAESQGGAPGGRVYIAWDDNFVGDAWPDGFAFDITAAPGTVTALMSMAVDDRANRALGEELLGGGDYDGDGRLDLFVGDMTAIPANGRANGGIGFVIFDAARLRGVEAFTPLEPDSDIEVTLLLGPSAGSITADTVHHGDFDADGIFDLAVAAPNASPDRRIQAGIVYVLWGNTARWPAVIDFAELPPSSAVQVTELWGVRGAMGADGGDMLAYSADVADLDGDGFVDLIMNEMGGNGVSSAAIDAGNMVMLSGALLASTRPDCAGYIGGGATIDACGTCAGGSSGVDSTPNCVQFRRDVQPVLLGECSQCHGNSGGLSVFSYDLLMQGTSDNGPVIIAGDPESSTLLHKIRRQPPFGDPMPPEYELPSEQVDVLKKWIEEGARDN